jgi:uncharacterized protein (DUF4415 family)
MTLEREQISRAATRWRFSSTAGPGLSGVRVHGISFETAREVFDYPHHLTADNYYIAADGEQRYQVIGMSRGLVLLLVAKRLKISEETRVAYGKRDRRLDTDPDAPQMPPEYWSNAAIGKYYRPLKTQISFRIDQEVLDWLKSKGQGHLSRINQILREHMTRERQ